MQNKAKTTFEKLQRYVPTRKAPRKISSKC